MRLHVLFALMVLMGSGWTQVTGDPAQREEADQERRKLLRAADTLDALQAKVESQTQELESLRADVAKLQAETACLREALTKADAARAKERQALIDEVTALLATKKPRAETPKPTPAPVKESTHDNQEGYEHIVEKGETLYVIAQAYTAQGAKVTVADLRKANHLGPNDPLKVGQKLFIPRK